MDIKPITVGADTYLAVANYRDDSSYTINSNIYKWLSAQACFGSGTTCGTVLQAIPTKGAYRMEAFTLEGGSYLAVSNSYAPAITLGYNQPSYIYKYIASGANCPAGGGFGNAEYGSCGTPFQAINTSGAYGWKFFTVGNVSYLAVANAYNGTSFNINSKIYQWMQGSQCFGSGTACGSAFQTIATNGATQMQTFTTGPDLYLIAANAYNGSSYNINSNFYQWMPGSQCVGDGTACGTAFQSVPTSGAAGFEPVTISGNISLATANYFNGTTRNINSSIMQWSPSGCGDTELGTPTVWTGDTSVVSNEAVVSFTTIGTTQWVAPPGVTSVNYLVVGGGGGGGRDNWSAVRGVGGGGGGGVLTGTLSVTPNSSYTVTVGAGGAGGTTAVNSFDGLQGRNSVFGSVTAIGGGGGGGHPAEGGGSGTGLSGGSGGGANNGGTGGAGIAGQGNNGGNGSGCPPYDGGGGGGAGAVGANSSCASGPGAGGAGIASSISGSSIIYAGGGGGRGNGGSAAGSAGGGGAGNGTSGAANTGGGGGANRGGNGGAGGSGIVVISYVPQYQYQTGIFSGSRLYTLGCKWLDGTTASSTSVKVTTQAELMLSANGSTTPTVYITPDTSALVQWSTKSIQQNSCTVTSANTYGWPTDNWAADNNPTGYSSPVLADGQSVAYTLACIELAGENASKEMTVAAATQLPSAASDMSISVKRVVRGGRPTLTWNAINLNPGISCSVTPALQNGVPEWDGTGTSWSSPLGGALGPILNTTTTFTLACVNKAGNSASVSATAYLVPAFKEL